MNAGALLHAHLANALVHAGGFDDGRPFLNLERQRLLDINIAPGIQSVNCDGGVPVVGRGDQHGVDFFHFEQLPMIGEVTRVRRLLFGLVDLDPVNIADGRDVHDRILLELRHVLAAALAAADHAELNFVIRAKYAGIRERGDSAGAAQKVPPSDFCRHVVDGRTGTPACPVPYWCSA